MPNFVLNRTYVLDGKGHKIRFEKGTPTWVPPELVREAMGIGAECIDAERPDPLGPEELPPEELTDADREALFFAAFDEITTRNAREDFGGDGKPTVAAVKKLVQFEFIKRDVIDAYRRWMATKQEA